MGESTRGLYSNASHSGRDQFLHFVRPRAQCVPLLRSSFVDISAPALLLCAGHSVPVCVQVLCVGQMADRVSDPSLPRSTLVYPGYQIPPRSTLIHPGLPRSTQFSPGLPRSSKDYMVRPRRRSASCLGQGWRVLVVLQFCKRNDCDQRLDFARLQTNW